jgi:hypothetical protein
MQGEASLGVRCRESPEQGAVNYQVVEMYGVVVRDESHINNLL